MMMKMGFKPGQALGVPANVDVDEGSTSIGTVTPPSLRNSSPSPDTLNLQPQIHEGGLVNPLPLNEWSGTSSHHVLPLPLFLLPYRVIFLSGQVLTLRGGSPSNN